MAWFVARTNPRQETVAVVFLGMLPGVATFLPYVTKKVLTQRGTLTMRREVMFPSYLFIGCEMNERTWSRINFTPGISRLIMEAGSFVPKELDGDLIEAIKGRMTGGAIRVATDRDFHDKQPVRITAGKYTGIEGLFGYDAKGRTGAFIKLFNRDQWVPVAEQSLTACVVF